MAINKNHEFEELNGVKCAVVEKNASAERVQFLKDLLEFNRFTVVVVETPAAKPAAAKPTVTDAAHTDEVADTTPAPTTYTIGVTDVTFNPTNAIFGRQLHTPDRRIVTLGYWQQKEQVSQDDKPYFM